MDLTARNLSVWKWDLKVQSVDTHGMELKPLTAALSCITRPTNEAGISHTPSITDPKKNGREL